MRAMREAMMQYRQYLVAGILVVALIAGGFAVYNAIERTHRVYAVAYFSNTTGLYRGDDVLIRGVKVGKVEKFEPQPSRVKVTFWFDRKYKVPADAKAAILAIQLVTGRAIQLTPPYKGGPTMRSGAVIPQSRTVMPIEWDEVRTQLRRLTDALKPTQPGGVSTLGAAVNSAADDLRGKGAEIRDSIIKLSKTVSALGDHSDDIFSTVKNLSTLVGGLHDSSDVLAQLNRNLAAVSNALGNDPNEVARAAAGLDTFAEQLRSFVADNREAVGTTADKLASITDAANASTEDFKQLLHVVAPAAQNFLNIYEPANGSLTGALAVANFANPVSFICGAVQAASRLGARDSARLCAQYLSPIIKNRQYPFLPFGENYLVNAPARPNELSYSEDWLRPDFVPPGPPPGEGAAPRPAEAPPSPLGAGLGTPGVTNTNPDAGLSGMMVPTAGGGR